MAPFISDVMLCFVLFYELQSSSNRLTSLMYSVVRLHQVGANRKLINLKIKNKLISDLRADRTKQTWIGANKDRGKKSKKSVFESFFLSFCEPLWRCISGWIWVLTSLGTTWVVWATCFVWVVACVGWALVEWIGMLVKLVIAGEVASVGAGEVLRVSKAFVGSSMNFSCDFSSSYSSVDSNSGDASLGDSVIVIGMGLSSSIGRSTIRRSSWSLSDSNGVKRCSTSSRSMTDGSIGAAWTWRWWEISWFLLHWYFPLCLKYARLTSSVDSCFAFAPFLWLSRIWYSKSSLLCRSRWFSIGSSSLYQLIGGSAWHLIQNCFPSVTFRSPK